MNSSPRKFEIFSKLQILTIPFINQKVQVEFSLPLVCSDYSNKTVVQACHCTLFDQRHFAVDYMRVGFGFHNFMQNSNAMRVEEYGVAINSGLTLSN